MQIIYESCYLVNYRLYIIFLSFRIFIDFPYSYYVCVYIIAHQCSSYQNFLSGKCFGCKPGSGSCALMAYHSVSSPGLENEISPQVRLQDNIGTKFFTTTGREFPFCRKLPVFKRNQSGN